MAVPHPLADVHAVGHADVNSATNPDPDGHLSL